MKHIVLSLVVAAMVPLAAACTKQTTTRTVGLNFGPLSCSVETTREKLNIDIEKLLNITKLIKPWRLFSQGLPLPDGALDDYKAQCKELFESFAENSDRK